MTRRFQLWVLALTAAIVGAVLIGTVAHDLMGLSRWKIRQEALAGAALVAIMWTAQSLFKPNS